jgi:hypothetical protein
MSSATMASAPTSQMGSYGVFGDLARNPFQQGGQDIGGVFGTAQQHGIGQLAWPQGQINPQYAQQLQQAQQQAQLAQQFQQAQQQAQQGRNGQFQPQIDQGQLQHLQAQQAQAQHAVAQVLAQLAQVLSQQAQVQNAIAQQARIAINQQPGLNGMGGIGQNPYAQGSFGQNVGLN